MTSLPLQNSTAPSLPDWLATPIGRYMLAWEQAQFDRAVTDIFGFHALQLGLPELDTLAANRMPHRWLGCDAQPVSWPQPGQAPRELLLTHSMALPFAEASLDLVTLPHSLELSLDPHATLREVARVLVPEGRVVITGFNPASLWGVRRHPGTGLPEVSGWIGHTRLRDWLQLLSFDVEVSTFGCYRPLLNKQRRISRWAWMDGAGSRWWPIFGAVYCLVAVKRVRGMRLLEPAWKTNKARQGHPVTTASKRMK